MVMVAVGRLGENAYGGAVQDELLRVAGRDVSVSSVYVTLVRLEDLGLLTSGQSSRGPGEVGRPRRVFEITDAGWEVLRSAREALDRIWDGVEPA
jgi:DNA-binding PadR family transcriptional regulator